MDELEGDESMSSQNDSMSSTASTDSHLRHIYRHDATVFGLSSDLSSLNLPTKRDILKYYFYLADNSMEQSRKFSYKKFTATVRDKLIEIWNMLGIQIILKDSITTKLNNLLDKYQAENKKKVAGTTFAAFVQSTNELFYIGRCKCNLKTDRCTCGLISPHLTEFMFDQNNDRKSTIPEYAVEGDELMPVTMTTAGRSSDPSWEPPPSMDMGNIADAQSSSTHVGGGTVRGTYNKRFAARNYAMVCDRFGASDRMASAMATALLKDFGIQDEQGNPLIMDKAKLRREKEKCRQDELRKHRDTSILRAFSFDGRKDDSLTREKIDGRYHTRMVKEPHLVILREPHSHLLGYVTAQNEDAEHKFMYLNEFFTNNTIPLDSLIGICTDGEPTNTGIHRGIIRRFELDLQRPLHWFVCLLHFNELPFRLLFETLEKSNTTGPRSSTGILSKEIETCEDRPVCNS